MLASAPPEEVGNGVSQVDVNCVPATANDLTNSPVAQDGSDKDCIGAGGKVRIQGVAVLLDE